MNKSEKSASIAYLQRVFQESASIVVAHNLGLTAMQMNALRVRMSKVGGGVKIAKNRLAKIALEGAPAANLSPFFSGPVVLLYGSDPVAAPKVAFEFSKNAEKFSILGGTLGCAILSVEEVKQLAELPSLEVLRGTLAGLLVAPQTKIARLVKEPSACVARVIGAYADRAQAA